MKKALNTIRKTKVEKGSKTLFYTAFLLYKTRLVLGRVHPSLKKIVTPLILLLPKKEIIIENEMSKFVVTPGNDTIGKSLPSFENNIRNWFTNIENKTFLDIGANIGFYTILAKKLGAEKIVGFEPNPDVYKIYEKNVKVNNIKDSTFIYNTALGAEEGSIEFLQNNFRTGISRLAHQTTDVPDINEENKGHLSVIEVNIRKLDNIIEEKEFDLQKIGFIKIDVEGFELDVIQGGIKTLNKVSEGTLLLVEIWKHNKNKEKTIKTIKEADFSLEQEHEDNLLFEKE